LRWLANKPLKRSRDLFDGALDIATTQAGRASMRVEGLPVNPLAAPSN
jgi:hypothetical protein